MVGKIGCHLSTSYFKRSKIFVFPTQDLHKRTEKMMPGKGYIVYGQCSFQALMFGQHRDVHVAFVCCLLVGHLAGGNAGAEGIAKEHSPP